MRATLNTITDLYALDNEPNAPSFLQFVAGIGYMDPKGVDHYGKHWFVVIGETEGHEYVVFIADSSNDLLGLAKALTNWKDDLCIQRVYLDGTDIESMRFLRGQGPQAWDGLAIYKNDGKDIAGKEKWIHASNTWPNFRNRETVTHLISVPDSIRVNLSANYDLLLALEKADRLKYRSESLMIATVRREEKREDIISHPLIKATVWTLAMLERSRPTGGEFKQPKPVYGNLRK